jgi:hypothetical protein
VEFSCINYEMKTEEYLELSEKDLRKLLQKSGLARHADDFVRRRNAFIVAERSRALRRFEAYQVCPKCQVNGFHLMKKGILGTNRVVRECAECGYEWEQE